MEYLQNPFMAYAETPTIAIETGYEMQTTYWSDFRVCGGDVNAIKDTYKRALALAKDDKVYGTELALVLNWLSWAYAETHPDISQLFVELYYEWDKWVLDNWHGDDLAYYLKTTD